MDKLFVIGLLVIGSICILISNAATVVPPSVTTGSQVRSEVDTSTGSTISGVDDVITEVLNNVTSCPRFDNRQENQTLYVPYIEGRCEMVVTVETVMLPPLRIVKMFKRGKRVIRRPVVNFRSVATEENGEPVTCESLPSRSLGPFVFVDTVPNECQMLLKIQKDKNETTPPRSPGQKKGNKPGRRPGKRPGKHPRHKFVPAYEYLDEVVY